MSNRNNKNQNYSKKNYQVQNRSANLKFNNDNLLQKNSSVTFNVIPSINIQGVRKVKNFTINIEGDFHKEGDIKDKSYVINYMLIYHPSGLNIPAITIPAQIPGELFKANQYIILQGILTPLNNKIQYSKLARNLNSGDSIDLILINPSSTTDLAGNILCNLNYAIAYN